MNPETQFKRKVWFVAGFTTLIMLMVMITTPLRAEDNSEVRKAVYGDEPFGLPWLAVHILVSVIICLPMPLLIVSSLELLEVGADLGVSEKGGLILFLYRSYRAISVIPELRGLYWRVTLTWAWYFFCFAGWIVLTSLLDV